MLAGSRQSRPRSARQLGGAPLNRYTGPDHRLRRCDVKSDGHDDVTQLCQMKLLRQIAAGIVCTHGNTAPLDPNETNELSMANSRFNIRKMIKDGLIIRKAEEDGCSPNRGGCWLAAGEAGQEALDNLVRCLAVSCTAESASL
eukprot:s12369_g2.t1